MGERKDTDIEAGQQTDEPAVPSQRLTMEMIKSGIDAYRRWDSQSEEEAALVVAIYLSMDDQRRSQGLA